MAQVRLQDPISFEPLFFERIWGGQQLATLYRKNIPHERRVGESWEIVDRPEAQSIARSGPFSGRTLHDLWVNFRAEIFGEAPVAPRFPLLIKLLDCQERLSLQVHPPTAVARALGGEPKTECWYITKASAWAELYLGFRQPVSPETFRQAIEAGTVADLIYRVPVKTGNAFLVPSGRVHAIGAGNLILEVQQNSDTTYRVFDWNRKDATGQSRELHLEEALACIDFNDCQPGGLIPEEERILSHELFSIERWELEASRELVPPGTFAIAFCLAGTIRCGSCSFQAGDVFLLPASCETRTISPAGQNSSLLRITLP